MSASHCYRYYRCEHNVYALWIPETDMRERNEKREAVRLWVYVWERSFSHFFFPFAILHHEHNENAVWMKYDMTQMTVCLCVHCAHIVQTPTGRQLVLVFPSVCVSETARVNKMQKKTKQRKEKNGMEKLASIFMCWLLIRLHKWCSRHSLQYYAIDKIDVKRTRRDGMIPFSIAGRHKEATRYYRNQW